MPLDFLKDLPSKNTGNFARMSGDAPQRASTLMPRAKVVHHVPPEVSEKRVVCDKTPMLLRYLQKHWKREPGTMPPSQRLNAASTTGNAKPGSSSSAAATSRRICGRLPSSRRRADDDDEEDEEMQEEEEDEDNRRDEDETQSEQRRQPPRKMRRLT